MTQETKPEPEAAGAPSDALTARIVDLEALAQARADKIEQLTGQLAGAEAKEAALTQQANALAAERDAALAECEQAKAEKAEAVKRLSALVDAGPPPVSATPAPENDKPKTLRDLCERGTTVRKK